MPETTLQPGAGDGIDTGIKSDDAAANFGTDATFAAAIGATGENWDILFKFDLSSIAAGSEIQEATLSLFCESLLGGGFGDPEIRRILSGNSTWTETGATWNTLDGTCDWAGAAGCETEGTDIAVTTLFTTDAYTWATDWNDFSLTVADFQALIDDANYGFKIGSQQRSPSVSQSATIRMSDHATATDHPKLFVRWIEPSGRLWEYSFSIYDPMKRVFNSQGAIVQPNEIRPDNWISVEGFELPRGETYSSLVKDPTKSYIVGVEYDEDGNAVSIKTDRNQFADAIIRRLSGGI